MKGDQKIIPKGLGNVRTHEWVPKHAVGYDESKKKRAAGSATPYHQASRKKE